MAVTDWPETNDYFSFYGLPPVYAIDTAQLKQRFLEKSRQFHPDFFGDDMQAQTKAIEITAFNNKAFRTLSQPMERMRYLIRLHQTDEGSAGTLPQEFLMEMMDLNEQLDELMFENGNEALKQTVTADIEHKLNALMAQMTLLAEKADWQTAASEMLKVNYLERLKNRLHGNGHQDL